MESDKQPEVLAVSPPTPSFVERRKTPRHAVDAEASILLLNRGTRVSCHIHDLSMTGCRMIADTRFRCAAFMRVEVNFRLLGLTLRFCGVVQWTDGQRMVGIRFSEMTSRRREELAEVLAEVEAANAAKAAAQTAEERATAQAATERVTEQEEKQRAAELELQCLEDLESEALLAVWKPTPRPANDALAVLFPIRRPLAGRLPPVPPPRARMTPAEHIAARAKKRERRDERRIEVSNKATIVLLKGGSTIDGQILDVSMTGCRICTDQRFPVGIYTRVETVFYLDGLPFRLVGVVQSLHEQNLAGIRFLDLSRRKRDQLQQLIDEIASLS